MKKIVIIALALILVSTVAFAAQVEEKILVLHTGATGTTSAKTGTAQYAKDIATSQGCDIITSPTASVVVLFRGGVAYQNTATFDASGLATATTCTTGACNVQFTKNLRAMDAVITASTPTMEVGVYCTVK